MVLLHHCGHIYLIWTPVCVSQRCSLKVRLLIKVLVNILFVFCCYKTVLHVCRFQARQAAQQKQQTAEESRKDYVTSLNQFNQDQHQHYHTLVPVIYQVNLRHWYQGLGFHNLTLQAVTKMGTDMQNTPKNIYFYNKKIFGMWMQAGHRFMPKASFFTTN